MWFGGDNWAGEPVTVDSALQLSAYWNCLKLNAQTIGTLPLGLYERLDDGTRKARGDHPLYKIIHTQPNADQTAAVFWEGMIAWKILNGTALAPKQFRGTGSSKTLIGLDRPLDPRLVTVDRLKSGALEFTHRDGTGKTEYAEDEIFVLRGFGLGGDVGLSPLQYARQSISTARATDRAAASHFANGMRPSGWLVYKGGTLEQADRELARQNIINPMLGAGNAGAIGILEGEFDYKQMTIPPEEAQLLESRRFSVEDVCRFMSTPSILIGHASQGQTMWGTGVEAILGSWYALGLRAELVRNEQEIVRQLVPAPEREKIYAEYSIEGLLRADSAARGEFYWKLFQMGVINGDWMADKENVPRPPHGKRYFVNSTLMPLDDEGVPIKGAEAAPTGRRAEDQNPPPPPRRLEVVQ